MQSEVNFLGRISHPNLVKLLGYCMEDNELLLVYEFMAKGSLENHLFRSESFGRRPFSNDKYLKQFSFCQTVFPLYANLVHKVARLADAGETATSFSSHTIYQAP